MGTFVLVHGAWHGSWCWKRVRRALQVQGHDVFTPTLTGVGERSHLLTRDVNLETHILDVQNLIVCEDLSDIVLCGHSYGGGVISGVADRVPDRIGALVYLDAFILESGQNIAQHVPEAQYRDLIAATDAVGEGWKVPPIPAEIFQVNAEDRQWVNRQCTPQPLDTFQQPLRLAGGIDRIRNINYVLASGFREGSPFPPFYERARAKGWKTSTIPCGHDVMLDEPEKLTRILTAVWAAQVSVT